MGAEALGFKSYIDAFWNWVRLVGKDYTENTNLDEYDLPTQTTNQELDELMDAAISTGESGTEFLFDSHHLGEALINFMSPYNLNVVIVAIIAGFFGILLLHKVAKVSFRHIMLFVFSLASLTVILMVIGPIEV